MIDVSQLDPTFISALYGIVVHYVTKLTQDTHGKTRPFVVVLCVVFGFLVAGLYAVFGRDTIWELLGKFIELSGVALTVASTIWVFSQKPVVVQKKLK